MTISRLTLIAAVLFAVTASAQAIYKKAPQDINTDGKYKVFVRYCYVGDMQKAEQFAVTVLDKGYRGTKYESWVYEKLASAYERKGDYGQAIANYSRVMTTSDPRKGVFTRAKSRIIDLGGTPPAITPTSELRADANPRPITPRPQTPRPEPRPPVVTPTADTRPPVVTPGSSRPSPSTPPPVRPQPPAQQPPTFAPKLDRDNGRKQYREAPQDINTDGKYKVFVRYCYVGDMQKAEQFAVTVLDKGYRGTKYESWVYEKLASAYERKADYAKAVQNYQLVMQTSDPRKGVYTRAKSRVEDLQGLLSS